MATWQPIPEMRVFWLTGNGVLSPGVIPPQVLPPSRDFMIDICWNGTALPPSKPQQTYIVPILPSRGRLGPPFTSVRLSTVIQFLSSRNASLLIWLLRLSCTTIGPVQALCGRLMWTVRFQPDVLGPPIESRLLK